MTSTQLNYNFPKIRFCSRGHALVGENLAIRPDRVRCKTCWKRPRRHSGALREETVKKVLDALNEGATLNMLNGRVGHTKGAAARIISHERVTRFIAKNPKIGAWIRKKSAENGRTIFLASQAKRRIHIAAPALVHNMSVLDDINSALTMWLDPINERPDIIADMWSAVAENRLHREDIKARAKEFVAAHRRGFTNTGRYGRNSLDAPAYRDSPVTLIETKEHGLWG